MLKSKFIDILKTFSTEEFKQFRDFINSPFHNSNKNVIKLYEIIRKFAPAFDSASIEKEKLFSKVYPGKKYNDTVIRILLSDLLRLGEEFLIQLRSKQNPFGENLLLLEELMDRGLDSLFRTNLNYTSDILKKMDGVPKYLNRYELEMVNIEYYLRKDKQQLITGNVLDRIESLIYFTLITLVRNIHDLIINERTFNAKFDINMAYEFVERFDFKSFLEKIKTGRPEHYPIISLYYNLLRALLEEENEQLYDILKASVEYCEKISKTEIQHFLHELESCCLNRTKYNPQKYREEIFYVYNLMLSAKSYSIGTDYMTAQRYKNILLAGINLNKIDWVEEFVNKYSEKVQPEYRESMFFYSRALISFCRKNFTESLENINKVRYDYLVLKMDVKSWTLKIYYELNYTEQALSLMDSYRHFLTKNKAVSDHVKERHLNFLKFAGELLKLKSTTAGKAINNFKSDLIKTGNVVHKDWMLIKADEVLF